MGAYKISSPVLDPEIAEMGLLEDLESPGNDR